MARDHLLKNRGFTLVEALIGVAITSIAVVGIASYLSYQAAGAKKQNLLNNTVQTSLEKKAAQQLLPIFETANIAMQFQHLPISTTCADERSPCLRKQGLDGNLVPLDVAPTGLPPYVEFFRDNDAQFHSPAPAAFAASSATATATIQVTDGLPQSLLQDPLLDKSFVTWPLYDNTSNPFLLVHGLDQSPYLIFQDLTAKTDSPPVRWTFFQVAAATASVDSIRGQAMLLYNAFDQNQYFIQQATDVTDCRNGPSSVICFNQAVAAGWTAATGFTAAYFTDPANPHYVLVKLEAINPGDFPPQDLVSLGVPTAASNWDLQTDFVPFPTRVASVSAPGDPDFPVDANPVDIRKIAHYYHMNQAKIRFVALPVAISWFTLENKRDTACTLSVSGTDTGAMCSYYSLNKRSYGQSTFTTMIPDLPLQATYIDPVSDNRVVKQLGSVHFARRLGTTNFNFFLYQSVGSPVMSQSWPTPPSAASFASWLFNLGGRS